MEQFFRLDDGFVALFDLLELFNAVFEDFDFLNRVG